MRRIVWIADHAASTGVARTGETQVLASRLAGDRAASIEDPRHHGGVELGHVTFQQRRAVHHGHAGHADVVLDRDLLAAQEPFAAALDIRLPVPGAVGIFRCRRPVSWRARRDRRQGRRHQLFEPAVRRQRPLERLLKGRNFFGREREAKIRPETIDLLQRRKADYHASPFFLRLQNTANRPTNEKSHPWPEKAPNGIHALAISGRLSLRYRTKSLGYRPDVIGCAKTLSSRTYSRTARV